MPARSTAKAERRTRRGGPPARARRHGQRLAVAGGILALGLPSAGCEPSPSEPPNLLLITIDTLRADRLACYGGPADVGAEICKLADDGTRVVWAFAAAPYTAPSVASILTSQYMAHHGVTQSAVSFLSNDVVTVAEILRAAGYTTAAFISNPVLDKTRSFDQGFSVYDQRMTRRERNRPTYVEREAQTTTDAVLAWAQVALREPWFIWAHYQDPHGPYEPPDAPAIRNQEDDVRLRVLTNHSGYGGIPAYQKLPGVVHPAAYEGRYLDEIRYLDSHVKRLVDGLDRLGRRPAVLLTADHGEAFGEDGYYFAHGHSVALDQIRVPLLWRPAERGKGRVEDSPVSLLDVAPTLLRVAGLEFPEGFEGRPLPVKGTGVRRVDRGRAFFSEHDRSAAVIREDTYYARNRGRFRKGEIDPISGGEIARIPKRTAHLEGDGPLPDYEPVSEDGSASDLEPLLRQFIEDTKGARASRRASVPEQTRERLRALGYLD